MLSNMGNHKQALEIYVFKMQDYGKAEEYVWIYIYYAYIANLTEGQQC